MDLVVLRGVSSIIPIFLGSLLAGVAASRGAGEIVPLFLAMSLSFVPDLYSLFGLPDSLAAFPLLHAPFRQSLFLFGPFLWYYVARKTGRRPRILLHAAIYPAAVAAYLLSPPGTSAYLPMAVVRICWFLVYSVAIVVFLRNLEEQLKDQVANPAESALPWLRYLIWWMTGIFLFMAAAGVVGLVYSIPWFLDLGEVLTRAGVTVFLTGCWLRALARPRLISPGVASGNAAKVHVPGQAEGATAPPEVFGAASTGAPAPAEFLDQIERRFGELMAAGAYREEALSLHACARRVGCPPQYLSYVLNHRIGERFSDHVARHRIRQILESLARGEHRRKTILALALEAGFQSKSAFYDAFRRATGTTPRVYLSRGTG